MSPHRLSTALEREVRTDLEARGYLAVRLAKSKGRKDDAKIDIVALYPFIATPAYFTGHPIRSRTYDCLLIQCKLSDDVLPVEKSRLIRAARKYGCAPVIASKTEPGLIIYEILPL